MVNKYNDIDYKIGYVVLHFITMCDTINCVESIKKTIKKDDQIIIVNNGSLENNLDELNHRYLQANYIEIVSCPNNMGFAKGNNIGFEILKNKYNMDFIILLNNDTIIMQDDWRDKIVEIYIKSSFAVLGPQILSKDGSLTDINPQIPIHTNEINVRIGQISNYIRYGLSFLSLDIVYNYFIEKKNEKNIKKINASENVQLAGCCLIFSKEYIQKFDGLNPETFLYLEEQILFNRIINERMKSIYSSDIQIVHLEESATRKLLGNKRRKTRRFKYKCQIGSFKVLLKQMRGYELNKLNCKGIIK